MPNLSSVSVLGFHCWDKNSMIKNQLGEKFILLTLPDYSPSLEEDKTETQA